MVKWAFKNVLERLLSISREPTEKFRSTLTKSGQMDVDVANTICWLVQSDRIYKNNQPKNGS